MYVCVCACMHACTCVVYCRVLVRIVYMVYEILNAWMGKVSMVHESLGR